mmetsp:Transcript_159539/g.387326  ORF Transcript_159539/g.387326 Transcript_159539/m.387326 type:complete len:481 (+) Transcript_159539:116-1558(+)
MLVLFETPAGYALFKVLDAKKMKRVDDIYAEFASPDTASDFVRLQAFHRFGDTTEALAAATAMVESKLGKDLKKFLKKNVLKKEDGESLAVIDSKLGAVIKEKMGIECVNDQSVMQLMRGLRLQMSSLIDGLEESDVKAMMLGLGHSLSRYKLKFSPDKVDTMIVQAIGLLDDLDKEINTYSMRVKEWYGWHFPELAKIVVDNMQYAKAVLKMGLRENAAAHDFSDIMEESVEQAMKETAVRSMGTDVSEQDISNIHQLCDQVVSLTEYRVMLFDYLQSRMNAIAPNLSIMVGELVGARLIAHAGSLMNLAKAPASTVQILGAEKALFRALKTKHETPKYGLIYHASLIGQAAPKNKGKISRVLAAKTALCVRVDALGESSEPTIALDARATVENRLRALEGGERRTLSGGAAGRNSAAEKFSASGGAGGAEAGAGGGGGAGYNAGADVVMDETPKKAKKAKKEKKEKKAKKSAKKARKE